VFEKDVRLDLIDLHPFGVFLLTEICEDLKIVQDLSS
jgi:hypothetical protein